MSDYLLVLGDREAVGWVLAEQRTAFPDTRRAEVRALAPKDRLLLYTTRGCWRNPTRDRGRVIAAATVASTVRKLDQPPEFGGRTFPIGCRLRIPRLVPFGEGPELARYVDQLDAFGRGRGSWAIRLRRPLVPLSPSDYEGLSAPLEDLERPRTITLEPYLRWWRKTT